MSASQEQYISSLKKIKAVEEGVEKEIENRRKEADNKISQLAADLKKAITDAKTEGEKLVDSSIEEARKKANAETEKVIQDATSKAENVSSHVTTQKTQEIIDILLKGME